MNINVMHPIIPSHNHLLMDQFLNINNASAAPPNDMIPMYYSNNNPSVHGSLDHPILLQNHDGHVNDDGDDDDHHHGFNIFMTNNPQIQHPNAAISDPDQYTETNNNNNNPAHQMIMTYNDGINAISSNKTMNGIHHNHHHAASNHNNSLAATHHHEFLQQFSNPIMNNPAGNFVNMPLMDQIVHHYDADDDEHHQNHNNMNHHHHNTTPTNIIGAGSLYNFHTNTNNNYYNNDHDQDKYIDPIYNHNMISSSKSLPMINGTNHQFMNTSYKRPHDDADDHIQDQITAVVSNPFLCQNFKLLYNYLNDSSMF